MGRATSCFRAGDIPGVCRGCAPRGPEHLRLADRIGDTDTPPYAAISSHDRPQFIPGHPTPIFRGDGGASYIDRDGRLRSHPSPGPSFLDAFFLGSDGNVYWPRSRDNYVFDRRAGYFRRVDAGHPDEQRQVEEILDDLEAAGSSHQAPGRINWGVTLPTRPTDSGVEPDSPAYMTQRRSAATPHFGLKVETEGDRLRLARGDRSRKIELPFVGYGSWTLTELERSGQVLFESRFGRQFFLIDQDLNLTVPEGAWRLSRPEAIYLPETGEAILTTGPNLPYLQGLFWLRDRRLSGPDACGDRPPPEQAYRTIPPPGAEAIDTEHMDPYAEPVWTGRAFITSGANGAFEVPLDGPVRRLPEFPAAWTQVWNVPDSELVLIDSCDRFFLYDGAEVVYASGDLTGFFDRTCVQGLQPIAHDPASGEIQLARRDWTVSVKRGLDKSGGALSGIGWTDWLNGSPNPTIWPGTEIFPNGRAVDPSRKPYWWKLPRFGFAIGQDTESRFIRLGADGRIVIEPGQPELDGFITYDNTRLVFDPGQGEPIAVAASGRRLVLIAADGKTRPLACGSHCALGWINTLESDLSNPAGVLIGAQAGLFRHTPDAGFEQILPISVTGPVFAIETVPQLAETIVEAGFGRFIWSEKHGIRRLGPTGGALYPLRLFSPPGSNEVFTSTRIPARFELFGAFATGQGSNPKE